MSPATAKAQLAAQLANHGEDIIIRRSGQIDVTARARAWGEPSKQMVGDLQQRSRRFIVSVASLADRLPLTSNDEALVRGRTCVIADIDDDTRRVDGELVALVLTVTG